MTARKEPTPSTPAVARRTTKTARKSNGRFIRTPAQRMKDKAALDLATQSLDYHQINQQLHFGSANAAFRAVQRAIAEVPVQAVEDYRAMERQKLAMIERRQNVILMGHDASESSAAANVLLRAQARRARLDGLDAPEKVALTDAMGKDVDVSITGLDVFEALAFVREHEAKHD